MNIPLVDRTEITAADVVPGTYKLSPLLGYGGRQPNGPGNEPEYNKLLINVLVLITPPSIPICFKYVHVDYHTLRSNTATRLTHACQCCGECCRCCSMR